MAEENFSHFCWSILFSHQRLHDSKPNSMGWGRARIGLGDWCLCCFASPGFRPVPPSPTLLVEHLQIYFHIFQLTSLVIPVTVHHHHDCHHQGLLLHFKTVFPFYFFILRSLHSGIWKGQRLFREVLEFYFAIAELSKTFAIYQFKNILSIGSEP